MGVMPEWHGKGVGSSLMEYVETTAKAQGCNYLMVKTLGPARPDPGYELTRQFYMKVGFCPLEEFQSIWPENPCLIMVKKI
jgi:GNAT superfamily N-acetyltransferase